MAVDEDRLAALGRKHRLRRLEVFGSALREDVGPGSEVDLLVEFQPGSRVGFLALVRAARGLSELLGRRVDRVPRRGLKPLIRDEVLAQAEVLFAE